MIEIKTSQNINKQNYVLFQDTKPGLYICIDDKWANHFLYVHLTHSKLLINREDNVIVCPSDAGWRNAKFVPFDGEINIRLTNE